MPNQVVEKFFSTPKTFVDFFNQCCDTVGDKPALRVERPCPALIKNGVAEPSAPLEEWNTLTYNQYREQAKRVATAFVKLGLDKDDGVNVLAFNSPEWFITFNACIMAGGLIGGLYATDSADILTYKCKLGRSGIICVDNEKGLEKIKEVVDNISYVKAVVYWGFETEVEAMGTDDKVKVLSWDQLLKMGEKENEEDTAVEVLEERMSSLKAEDCCVLVFTSGTTGMPKAVRISHDNIMFDCFSVHQALPKIGLSSEERVLSYLPLSHVAGMLNDIVLPIFVGGMCGGNSAVTYFARPYDLRSGTIGDRLRIIRPTVFFGVPRVWEKIMEKMLAVGQKVTGFKKTIGSWAKSKGLEHVASKQYNSKKSGPLGVTMSVCNMMVFDRVKEALGLQDCIYAVTGAAPMRLDCFQYFASLNINIIEVYGMSESCGASVFGTPDAFRWGCPGQALPNTEVKVFKVNEQTGEKVECPILKEGMMVSEEEQGEICMRGRHIMRGYHANPDLGEDHVAEIAKKNKDTVDCDGWLHSGDKGYFDADGFLHITGRYKEIIIGAGGENIAPIPVENALKKYCPAISNVMMVGDQQKFNVALITLKTVGSTGELAGSAQLAGPAQTLVDNVSTIQEAVKNEEFLNKITDALKQTNSDPSVIVSQPHKIGKFTILPHDFSIENGELTSTLKLKRSVVTKIHQSAVDEMYKPENIKTTYIPYPDLEAVIETTTANAA